MIILFPRSQFHENKLKKKCLIESHLFCHHSNIAMNLQLIFFLIIQSWIIVSTQDIDLEINNQSIKTEKNKTQVCKERMILDEEGFCKCLEGYLYDSLTDDCFSRYSQVPCAPGKIFVHRVHEKTASCIENRTIRATIGLFSTTASVIKAPQIVTESPPPTSEQCKPGTQKTATGYCKPSL